MPSLMTLYTRPYLFWTSQKLISPPISQNVLSLLRKPRSRYSISTQYNYTAWLFITLNLNSCFCQKNYESTYSYVARLSENGLVA